MPRNERNLVARGLPEGLATQIYPILYLSLSASFFSYSFLFSLFVSFWPFGLSYFLTFSLPIPLFPNPFVPFTIFGKRRDDMLPLPDFYFLSHPSALFLAHKRIFLLHFSFLISYLFLSFLAYSLSRFLFRALFSFSTLSIKIAKENFLIWTEI